ncbi:Agenet domain containing protein [Senna tora]|uniref:Agenet domain containing protein n=1 Tax=Senna tora TaxID=362788 RepID=A0A834WA92_9FABA|nr:Agenet domain containing protein [Senna tora]
MFYVVDEEFLRLCGKEGAVHAGFKWRSRREVVDWLTSMLSKQHLLGDRTVVQVSRKQIKVQYNDVQDEDGEGNLEV